MPAAGLTGPRFESWRHIVLESSWTTFRAVVTPFVIAPAAASQPLRRQGRVIRTQSTNNLTSLSRMRRTVDSGTPA